MNPDEQKEREHLLEKTKMQLMLKSDTVFYTSILFSLVYVWEKDKTRTAAVDGKHLFINPEFFDSLPPKQRLGVFVHEVLHVALNHITRGLNHDPTLSNYAADYVVNLIVVDAGFELPDNCLLDRLYENMSYEQVYKILKAKQKETENTNNNTGGKEVPGIGSDILKPANKAEAATLENEITDIVYKATLQAQQINAWGNIPNAVKIELDKTLNPKLPWHLIFQNYMDKFAKDDYSWQRPNRKYLPDLIMPSQYSEAVTNIAFAIDSSGSVSNEKFGYFTQEVEVVQQQLQPELITLINFAVTIREIHEITQDIDILEDIEFTGRGGTNARPVLAWAKENNPELLVIFTDGYFGQPPADLYPDCPVLWIIHNNPHFKPENGEVIHYEL